MHVCPCVCVKVTHSSNQHIIIKSWVKPCSLTTPCLSRCLVLLLSCRVIYCVCVCVLPLADVHVEWTFSVGVSVRVCVCVGLHPLEFSLRWEWMTEPSPNICVRALRPHTERLAGERPETRGRSLLHNKPGCRKSSPPYPKPLLDKHFYTVRSVFSCHKLLFNILICYISVVRFFFHCAQDWI